MNEYTCAMTKSKLVTTDGIMSHGVYYESTYKMIITKDLHSTEQSSILAIYLLHRYIST